jgi:molybdopterin-biosynthesis enzyme MoeA-like protein
VSPEPRVVGTARAVTIGAEILSGKIQDTNSHELAKTLRRLGIELLSIVIVPDEVEAIQKAVREAKSKADVVFTSGGVGPTHDDKTIEGVARALDRRLVPFVSPRDWPGNWPTDGKAPPEAFTRACALVPEGTEFLFLGNPYWPTLIAGNVWMLPGIPELFKLKMTFVGEHLVGPTPLFSRSLYLSADEFDLLAELNRVVANHPEVEVGSYPAWNNSRYRTQVTFDARSDVALTIAYQEFEERVRPLIVPDGPTPPG